MPTLLESYQQVCTEGLIPRQRQKDVLTALKYLAATYEATPDQVPLTPGVEATYRRRLRDSLTAAGKGYSTVRNAIQSIGQLLKAYHQTSHTAPLPHEPRTRLGVCDALRIMRDTSPYRHLGILGRLPYRLPVTQWPADVVTHFEAYRSMRKDTLRAATFVDHRMRLQSYLGYLSLSGDARLARLCPEALAKIGLERYQDDRQEILRTPSAVSWDACFDVRRLRSFITWHAWCVHPPIDAKVRERPPSKPSQLGHSVVSSALSWAVAFGRDEYPAILELSKSLTRPRKAHNKRADYHSFTFAELESVALELVEEARQMRIAPRHWKRRYRHFGKKAAKRFMIGLILMMGWRIPMRARNWCEALLGTNLRKRDGAWLWHFEGAELKIATRRGETNIFEMSIPAECVPYLEEYLERWRPMLPNAADEQHVFLSGSERYSRLQEKILTRHLQAHVFRFTGKRFYTHLLRTIFTSNMMSSGVDVNSVAYGLNDAVQTVLTAYNELYEAQHRQNLQDAYRRHLQANGT